jgi:U6 snRNA-associated Sm-like protein LSm4
MAFNQPIFAMHLMKTAENHYMMVELKNGQSVNGTLVEVDRFMNLSLQDAIVTSKDGDSFFRIPHIFIKGAALKHMQLVEGLLEVHTKKLLNKKNRDGTQEKKEKSKKGKEEFSKGLKTK